MDSQHCSSGGMPQVEIPDEKDQRFCVLSYEQVKRLNDLMSDVISIHGRGNFPTIDVKLCDLVSVVRRKLEEDGVHVKEIRLNGSGASTVLVRFSSLKSLFLRFFNFKLEIFYLVCKKKNLGLAWLPFKMHAFTVCANDMSKHALKATINLKQLTNPHHNDCN